MRRGKFCTIHTAPHKETSKGINLDRIKHKQAVASTHMKHCRFQVFLVINQLIKTGTTLKRSPVTNRTLKLQNNCSKKEEMNFQSLLLLLLLFLMK